MLSLSGRVSIGMKLFSQQLQIGSLIESIKQDTQSTNNLNYIEHIIVIFYQRMRLYSLRESPIFKNVQKYSSKDVQNEKSKLQVIFRSQMIFQVIVDLSMQYYLRITDRQRVRQAMINVSFGLIHKMLLFADHLVLMLQDKLIRYIKIEDLLQQHLHYQTRKITLNQKSLKCGLEKSFLSPTEEICFSRNRNYMYIIEMVNKTITIIKFNHKFQLQHRENYELSQAKKFQKIRFIPQSYEEHGYEDAHFCIQMTFHTKLYCLYFLEISENFHITFSKIYKQKEGQFASKLKRINENSYVLYFFNHFALIQRERDTNKWFLQYQIFTQGQIISQLNCTNFLFTLEKVGELYCLFQYDLDKMINLQEISPYLIQTFQKQKTLSHIENEAGMNIVLVGPRPFLLEKCIFNIFYVLRDVRNDHLQYCYQNLTKVSKQEIEGYQIIKKQPQQIRKRNLIQEISQYQLIEQTINHLARIIRQLSFQQNRSILFYFSYEYFTIFLYVYHFLIKEQNHYHSDMPYIPSNLKLLISSVIQKCSQFYAFFRKNQKFTKLRILSKKVYSIAIFCNEQLKSVTSTFQNISTVAKNTGCSVVGTLLNPTVCLEYVMFELVNCSKNKNANSYFRAKLLLTQLLELSDDYPPLVYLLLNRLDIYIVNSHHLLQIQSRRLQEAQHDQSIIDCLKGQSTAVQKYKRYNCLYSIQQFSHSSHSKSGRNLLCIRDFSSTHSQKEEEQQILTKSCKTFDKLIESQYQIGGAKSNQFLELSEQQIIRIKIQMNQKIPLQLIGQQMSKYYNFCACAQLEHIKIEKSILILIDQILFIRRFNYRRKYDIIQIPNQKYQRIFEQNGTKVPKKASKKDRMLTEFQNLIDPLLLGYTTQLAKICAKFNISSLSSFSSKYVDAGQINRFDYFLRKNNYERSEIKQCQVHYRDADTIISKIGNQISFVQFIEEKLMEAYLFLAKLQQNKFQISEHVRSNCLAEDLVSINRLKRSCEDKSTFKSSTENLQQKQFIAIKQLNKNVKQMRNRLTNILDTTSSQYLIFQLYIQLIDMCLALKIGWIGDPLDLFMQIVSQLPEKSIQQGFLDNLCSLLRQSN